MFLEVPRPMNVLFCMTIAGILNGAHTGRERAGKDANTGGAGEIRLLAIRVNGTDGV